MAENMLLGDNGGRLHSVEVSDSGYTAVDAGTTRAAVAAADTADRYKLDSLQRHGRLYGWCMPARI